MNPFTRRNLIPPSPLFVSRQEFPLYFTLDYSSLVPKYIVFYFITTPTKGMSLNSLNKLLCLSKLITKIRPSKIDIDASVSLNVLVVVVPLIPEERFFSIASIVPLYVISESCCVTVVTLKFERLYSVLLFSTDGLFRQLMMILFD